MTETGDGGSLVTIEEMLEGPEVVKYGMQELLYVRVFSRDGQRA